MRQSDKLVCLRYLEHFCSVKSFPKKTVCVESLARRQTCAPPCLIIQNMLVGQRNRQIHFTIGHFIRHVKALCFVTISSSEEIHCSLLPYNSGQKSSKYDTAPLCYILTHYRRKEYSFFHDIKYSSWCHSNIRQVCALEKDKCINWAVKWIPALNE